MESITAIMPMWLFIVLVVWDLAWKAVAMWKSARRGQLAWFVCIAVFNTVGILPIIYLFLNRNSAKTV